MYQTKYSQKSNIKTFDIFSLPFQFNFGDEGSSKKTYIGGIFSLIIILLSCAYFIYLCILYFDNRIQPSVNLINTLSKDPYSMDIDESFIAIKIMIKDKNLIEFEKQKQKIYMEILVMYFDDKQQEQISYLIPCKDESLKQYMCIDFESIQSKNKQNLNFYPNEEINYNYFIFFNICDQNKYGQDCADEKEIRESMISIETEVNIRFGLKQYNPQTKKVEERINEDELLFDENLAFFNRYVLKKTDLTISSGFLIQSNEKQSFFSDYQKQDKVVSQNYINKEYQSNLLGALTISIGKDCINQFIQYPLFTSILAQFTSIFNTLMVFGIIIKIFTQTEILQSFVELQLKFYYKKTAEQIIDDTCDQNDIKKVKSDGVISFWKYIQNMDFKNIQNKLNISFFKKQNIFIPFN